jgi:hypothetical protein
MHDTSFTMQMDASDDLEWRDVLMIAFLMALKARKCSR